MKDGVFVNEDMVNNNERGKKGCSDGRMRQMTGGEISRAKKME